MIEKIFKIKEAGSNYQKEIIGGITTFLTLSYILFVQPIVLSQAGMEKGAVFVATVLGSLIATVLMAILANYPIALAPAMGHNFFFAYTVVLLMKIPWQVALGSVFIASSLFVILSRWGFREKIIQIVPESLKHGIAVGIGLLIALVGLEWGGIVVGKPGTIIGLGDLHSPIVLITLFGVLTTIILMVLKVRGFLLFGILSSTIVSLIFGYAKYEGIFSLPPSIAPTFLKLDILGAFKLKYIEVIFVFFFLALFDTVGTLIGVTKQAGLMKNGNLPRAREALISDAIGTTTGSLLGTSTITCYIESAAGVAEGAKTGFANIITAFLFLISLFFYPVIAMVGKGYTINDITYYPTISCALIIVGSFMFKLTKDINWEDLQEAIPAFLSILVMPVTFSITEGIAFGFISYSILSIFSKKFKKIHWLFHLFSLLFILRYIFLFHNA